MSARWDGDGLLQPISETEPCGRSLEESDTFAAFDAYELFGQSTLDIERDQQGKEIRRKNRPPDWGDIQQRSLDALRTSKDLRLLAFLGSALLRTDGIPAFGDTLAAASAWIEQYWAQVYPRVDDDVFMRLTALNCFADPVAIVDGVRRAPLVSTRQHGRFSLRDVELAAGQLRPKDGESLPDEKRILASFEATPVDELRTLNESVTRALGSLSSMDAIMRREGGDQAAPNFELLSSTLKKVELVLRARLANRIEAGAGTSDEQGSAERDEPGAAVAVGAIKSREDAMRAIDAAAEFFRRNEPSSPVPLFLDRARRLVAKDFLEVLADVAPDALPKVRSAGGLKNE